MIDLFDMSVSKKEIVRCLDEGAVNWGALLTVLVDKGILTVEEVDAAKIRVRAEMDQLLAERDKKK